MANIAKKNKYICRLIKFKFMENNSENYKLLYNTERVQLLIPEYGRNVQKMVDYLKTIEDRDKRNEQARAVVKVMEIINPDVHLQEDFEHKLWDHLFIIAGYDLDIDAPYPMPEPSKFAQKPLPVPLNKKPVKAMHYGRNIENIIGLLAGLEDNEEKTALLRSLGIYMKYQYMSWNKETVSDATIFADITRLSDGRITIPDGLTLTVDQPEHNSYNRNQFRHKGGMKQKNKFYRR